MTYYIVTYLKPEVLPDIEIDGVKIRLSIIEIQNLYYFQFNNRNINSENEMHKLLKTLSLFCKELFYMVGKEDHIKHPHQQTCSTFIKYK